MKLKIILLAGYQICCLTIFAQTTMEFAGPDKTILAKPDGSQTVDIGLPGEADACYEWSGDSIIIVGDPHNPVVTVNPKAAINRYVVTKTSKKGIFQDEVVVYVRNIISIKQVNPKVCCYNIGDRVKLEDFEIITDPPGYGNLASVTPMFLNNHDGGNGETENLTFSIYYNNHTSTKTVPIAVYGVDESTISHPTTSIDIPEMLDIIRDIKTFGSFFNKVADALQELKSISDRVSKIPIIGLPCHPTIDLSIDIDNLYYYKPSSIKSCCQGRCIEGWRWNPGSSFTGSVGFECTIPTPLSVGTSGLTFVIGVQAGGTLGPLSIDFYPKELINALKYSGNYSCAINSHIPARIFVNVSGAVQLALLDPSFLSVKGGVEGSLSKEWIWNVGQNIGLDNITLTIYGFYQVRVIGLVSLKGKYTLYTKRLF